MKAVCTTALALVLLLLAPARPAVAAEPDAPGTKDHPLFTRMPGFYISRAETKDFESYKFRGPKGEEHVVEGRYVNILYSLQPGATEPSRVQIQRNHEAAIKKIGGSQVYVDDDGGSDLTVKKDGKEFWVHLDAYITTQYVLTIVEKAGMAQDVVANAAVFSDGLRATGHVAVYGIYFDTGKSALKPESDPTLAEIAKLLKSDASLKLHVVGHTDNQGGLDSNMKLSQARAEAVVQALTKSHAIAAARLKGAGVGPLCPVASNDAEDGRAKNRRVELVKQ